MAKGKKTDGQIVGGVVDYLLTGFDAKRLNEKLAPKDRVSIGECLPLDIENDRGGHCVDGRIRHRGAELEIKACNRGPSLGQWDWPREAA